MEGKEKGKGREGEGGWGAIKKDSVCWVHECENANALPIEDNTLYEKKSGNNCT